MWSNLSFKTFQNQRLKLAFLPNVFGTLNDWVGRIGNTEKNLKSVNIVQHQLSLIKRSHHGKTRADFTKDSLVWKSEIKYYLVGILKFPKIRTICRPVKLIDLFFVKSILENTHNVDSTKIERTLKTSASIVFKKVVI